MSDRQPSPIESRAGGAAFPPTQWSVVLRAGQQRAPESSEALEHLCRTYWPPLYAFVRRRGFTVPEAQDLVQEFISTLLERQDLVEVAPSKGRFRSFLLAALNHFLANEWNRAQRQKRGGGKIIISLDQALAEGVPGVEPAAGTTPEQEYERRWVETLIQRALARLRAEWDRRYQPRHFDDLKVYLVGERGAAPFAETATRLGLTEPAVKSVVHRLRKRFGELFREEIAQTVASATEVEDELRHLFAVLARPGSSFP